MNKIPQANPMTQHGDFYSLLKSDMIEKNVTQLKIFCLYREKEIKFFGSINSIKQAQRPSMMLTNPSTRE